MASALPLGIAFVVFFFLWGWALHSRSGRAVHRWTEDHPFVTWLPLAALQLVIAAIRLVQGPIWLAVPYAVTAVVIALIPIIRRNRRNS